MKKWVEYSSSTYSWHQATVLLLVPYNTKEDELHVTIEQDTLVAGVRGQPPLIKGRLYGNVDKSGSMWQLEPRTSGLSLRDRTTSTTSTTSTRSSYTLISEPEISSSFAASLASGPTSDTEDFHVSSPGFSSPVSSADEHTGFSTITRSRRRKQHRSRTGSPLHFAQHIVSPLSSVESLNPSGPGRLLTLHLEKSDSIIWPSLIVGPVSEALSPYPPAFMGSSSEAESLFNMDPTSLTLTALELFDIRKDHDKAFEYFARVSSLWMLSRAWLQAHLPSATMRLVSHYVPLDSLPDPLPTPSEDATEQGRITYYIQALGGAPGLAQLYLEAGLLHLEGAASMLLTSSYSPLSSIRLPTQSQYLPDPSEGGSTAAWKRDREAARRYFDRARALCPSLEVPALPAEDEGSPDDDEATELGLRMPSVDLRASSEANPLSRRTVARGGARSKGVIEVPQRARRTDDLDSAWYLYVPNLVGAGTALLVVGPLLQCLWHASDWHCCADGGANRLHDLLSGGTNADTNVAAVADRPTGWIASLVGWLAQPRRGMVDVDDYIPDLVKGDLDSVREEVRRYYETQGVPVIKDGDLDSTDLMKCIQSLQEKEEADGLVDAPHDLVLLGGLSGRLDHTVHTLSFLHKLRKSRRRIFVVTDENVGWVLDEGKHRISIDHSILGPTCGLLPVGVDSTVLTTTGLRWNLTGQCSGFDGLLSTSNHLVPEEDTVFVETSRPIWWVAEMRREGIRHSFSS
ncbi:hypothetical protein BC827DRAFT_1260996 [Russula dissimulans]|nr:hypothetical protein BC827DRAFT_1260996 [Russula dissimulans]